MTDQQQVAAAAAVSMSSSHTLSSSSAAAPVLPRRDHSTTSAGTMDSDEDEKHGDDGGSATNNAALRPRRLRQLSTNVDPRTMSSTDVAVWIAHGSPPEKQRKTIQRTVCVVIPSPGLSAANKNRVKAEICGSFGEFGEKRALEKVTLGPLLAQPTAHFEQALVTFADVAHLEEMLSLLTPLQSDSFGSNSFNSGSRYWQLPRPDATTPWLIQNCHGLDDPMKYVLAQHLDKMGFGHYNRTSQSEMNIGSTSTHKTASRWSINLRVIEAKNLAAMDVTGSCDPYCRVYYQPRDWYKYAGKEAGSVEWKSPRGSSRQLPSCISSLSPRRSRPGEGTGGFSIDRHEDRMHLESTGKMMRTLPAEVEGLFSIGQTQTRQQTQHPQWRAEMQFTPPPQERSKKRGWLIVDTFDRDKLSSDDPMGRVLVDLEALEDDTIYDKWYPLVWMPGQTVKPKGEIRLQLAVKTPLRLSDSWMWVLHSYDFVQIQTILLEQQQLLPYERCQLAWHLDDLLSQAFGIFDVGECFTSFLLRATGTVAPGINKTVVFVQTAMAQLVQQNCAM